MLLTVRLLLLQLVLQQLDLLQLRVELELKVLDHVAPPPGLVRQLLVLNLQLDYLGLVDPALLRHRLQLSLQLFNLIVVLVGLCAQLLFLVQKPRVLVC